MTSAAFASAAVALVGHVSSGRHGEPIVRAAAASPYDTYYISTARPLPPDLSLFLAGIGRPNWVDRNYFPERSLEKIVDAYCEPPSPDVARRFIEIAELLNGLAADAEVPREWTHVGLPFCLRPARTLEAAAHAAETPESLYRRLVGRAPLPVELAAFCVANRRCEAGGAAHAKAATLDAGQLFSVSLAGPVRRLTIPAGFPLAARLGNQFPDDQTIDDLLASAVAAPGVSPPSTGARIADDGFLTAYLAGPECDARQDLGGYMASEGNESVPYFDADKLEETIKLVATDSPEKTYIGIVDTGLPWVKLDTEPGNKSGYFSEVFFRRNPREQSSNETDRRTYGRDLWGTNLFNNFAYSPSESPDELDKTVRTGSAFASDASTQSKAPHGTQMASIALGGPDLMARRLQRHAFGAAIDDLRLHPVWLKVANLSHSSPPSLSVPAKSVNDAISYFTKVNPTHVLLMSFNADEGTIDVDPNKLIVAAAGNRALNVTSVMPARLSKTVAKPNVISVGAYNLKRDRASWSNKGADILGPGCAVPSITFQPGAVPDRLSTRGLLVRPAYGTSPAAAAVAHGAGLVRAHWNEQPAPFEVKERLIAGSDFNPKLTSAEVTSRGSLNIEKALLSIRYDVVELIDGRVLHGKLQGETYKLSRPKNILAHCALNTGDSSEMEDASPDTRYLKFIPNIKADRGVYKFAALLAISDGEVKALQCDQAPSSEDGGPPTSVMLMRTDRTVEEIYFNTIKEITVRQFN